MARARTSGIAMAAVGMVWALGGWAVAADPSEPAVVTVTDRVIAREVEPLGVNLTSITGGTNNATNQLFPNPGFEPIVLREVQRVTEAGPGWFAFDNMTNYELRGPGFGNGARVRFFRLVDAQGGPLPYDPGTRLDVSRAHHVEDLGEARVRMPEASHPVGGWVATKYGSTSAGGGEVRYTTGFTDPGYFRGEGETGWYVVKAVDASGNESAASAEVQATVTAASAGGPRLVGNGGKLPNATAGGGYWATLSAVGGQPPHRFEVVEGRLPEGLQLDAASGSISGTAKTTPGDTALTIAVTDAAGQSDRRVFHINAPGDARDEQDRTAPEPPSGLRAVAGKGYVTLSWKPSPSADVAYYKVLRSDVPLARQEERVYLDRSLELRPGDHAFVYLRTREMGPETSHFRVRTAKSGSARTQVLGARNEWTYRLVPHPAPVPPELSDPGETCLAITATGSNRVAANAAVFFPWQGYTGEDRWYSQMHPGAQYRAEVWLRQDGQLGDGGKVGFILNGCYRELDAKTPWNVGTTWKRYTYDLTAPAYPKEGYHSGPGLTFTGPGTLYVDNFLFYRLDADHKGTQGPTRFSFHELMASMPATGKKGCLRVYPLGFGDVSMAANLGLFADSNYVADWYTAVNNALPATMPIQLTYALRTGDRPETRMVPMLTLSPDFFPEEWQALVEYLGVPYDAAAGDTPQTRPHAHRRSLQRGHGRPWIDDFREIVVEIGNETWHNKAMPAWDGFGWTNAVMQGGKEYGLFARHMIDETVMRMPAWKQHDLGKKIRWALGGNYTTDLQWGYGELAMAEGPTAGYLGHANYVGPKWETGDAAETSFTDDGVQKTLLGFLMNDTAKATVDGAAMSRDALRAQKKADYELVAYEGGPSGYDHRNLTNPTSELYGKSLAMGVAALDSWLHSSAMGYKHQCYLGYGSGTGWSSHTMPELGGFRGHAGWLALRLRNRFATGDQMLAVEVAKGPTLALGGKEWPLVGGYAFTDGAGNLAVFVLSRKLDGKHSGTDLGDGSTPVTLRLPVGRAQKITLHTLADPSGKPADPRSNNIEAEKVAIVTKPVPVTAVRDGILTINAATGGLPGGLPPGTVFLYVFEGVTPGPGAGQAVSRR